jgi:hypothetical protein
MSSRVESLYQNRAGDFPSLWKNTKVRTALQVLFLLGMGALATFAKRMGLPLRIPGHDALFWMGVIIAGRAFVRRDGAATLMGASMAAWGVPLGLDHTFLSNLWAYGASGLAIDLVARIPGVSIRNPFGAVLCGAVANSVNFGFVLVPTLASSVVKNFLLLGIAKSEGYHLLFGVGAGLLGWGAYRVWQSKQDSDKKRGQSSH